MVSSTGYSLCTVYSFDVPLFSVATETGKSVSPPFSVIFDLQMPYFVTLQRIPLLSFKFEPMGVHSEHCFGHSTGQCMESLHIGRQILLEMDTLICCDHFSETMV